MSTTEDADRLFAAYVWVTSSMAAQMAGVSETVVKRWCARGDVVATKRPVDQWPGNMAWKIDREGLLEFLQMERLNGRPPGTGKRNGTSYSPEYRAWASMGQHGHAGRVAEWTEYERFVRDVGPRPTNEYRLRRLRTDQPLGPGNAVWGMSVGKNLIQTVDGTRLTLNDTGDTCR